VAIVAALGGLVLATACGDLPQTSRQETPRGNPEDPVEPVFGQPLDPAWMVMRSPTRVAAAPGGYLLVTDSRRHVVLRVDGETLEPDQAFQTRGKPLAIGMHAGRIFVGNATTGSIDVYEADGSYRQSFGPGAAPYPSDLAVDPLRDLIFAVAGETADVRVFDLEGRLSRIIADGGALHAPTGIALDWGRQLVLVSDYGAPGGHAAVKIFDYDGAYVGQFSGEGDCGMMGCSGGFSRPQGIGVDDGGLMYVTDALLGQVMVWDRQAGEQVAVLGAHVSDGGRLRLPLDVLWSPAVGLVVISHGTAAVERLVVGLTE
jgi:DNA-binding beta-propeller fold protein YncE